MQVLRNAQPGSVVVVHSTVHPDTCRELCAVARENQIELLDAPVTGGPGGAQTGSLSIMVGGSESALDRCRPVLDAMGTHVSWLGDPGSGQLAKIANNLGLAMTMRAVHEAVVFAAANEISPTKMIELLGWGTCDSWVVQNWSTIGRSAAHYQAGGPRGVANLTYKDLALALSIAHSRGVALPGTGLTAQLVAEPYLSAAGYAEATSAAPDAGEE